MIARGDRQHDIAAVFAVNGGRIGETSTGENFAHVVAASSNIPPKAPYLVVSGGLRAKAKKLQVDIASGSLTPASAKIIDEIVQAFDDSYQYRRGK